MRTHRLITLLLLGLGVSAEPILAHAPWLLPSRMASGRTRIELRFSEAGDPGGKGNLNLFDGTSVLALGHDGSRRSLEWKTAEDGAKSLADRRTDVRCYLLKHEHGLMERGDESFVLRYYAKTGAHLGRRAWQGLRADDVLDLDIEASWTPEGLRAVIRFRGEPVEGARLTIVFPSGDETRVESDAHGTVRAEVREKGVYALRARFVEDAEGILNEKTFDSIRHHSTLMLDLDPSDATPFLPPLPGMVTSFGAAMHAGHLYFYGGHIGAPHSYSAKEQGTTLWSLDGDKGEWKDLAEGPNLQGLALVSANGHLYRLGGFSAKNAKGEEHDLWSRDLAVRFDSNAKEWSTIAPLPEPRSSFDAAVLDDKIYVVGGWNMQGKDQETEWLHTAWVLDTNVENPGWEALPKPPFQRRALALAAHAGRIWCVGGMEAVSGPTTQVHCYDPATQSWSAGPALPGEEGEGFGCSAFACGGRLYTSTVEGNLQRLSTDGKTWEKARELPSARFFHRMLAFDDEHLVILGGANMKSGKFAELELIRVAGGTAGAR